MPSVQARLARAGAPRDQIVLHFPLGLPGFERYRRFRLASRADLSPIMYLKSLDPSDLRLCVAPIAAVDSGYSLEISREHSRILGFDGMCRLVPDRDVVCLAILCLSQNGAATANLLAPIVINVKTRVAVQAVRADARYSHRHPIGSVATC